ncbi:hypothetical protein PVK06_005127 [Gossypium arboreum]|uniref:Uncharacterized protein n=1 Tax=Gossypium arboreum TaxID=29729 RepID=A0ABR0QTU0_GOSAR|nr:hypothetical protein PVK06_005127 [Gossypium arboreum]
MSSVMQKQHENLCIAKEIMTNLEDLLGGHVALDQQSTITNLMNSQQKIGTSVKEHMLKLKDAYNLGNKALNLTQLMKEL